ncbi:MAG: DUF1501 domain-containing protein [Pirellulales bacterium]|nr:DUF1501 domain-containing protein [Pirellulales bacterium]
MNQDQLSRRAMLCQASTGFGMLALAGLISQESPAAAATTGRALSRPHFPPKAKNVIFCYMSGGVSHIDSFDPKPRLAREAGKPMPMKIERTMFNNNGNIFPSPFEFTRHGDSGIPVSSMFPHIGECADELAVIRSMTSEVNEHAQANYFMHTGFTLEGSPSAGAWASYGLGSENQNLPGFVVLQSGYATVPHGGVGLYSNGFLPANHQGSIIHADQPEAVKNIRPAEHDRRQRQRLDLVRQLDELYLANVNQHAPVEAAINNFETAYRMQSSVPELCDISGESPATRAMYGLDDPHPSKAAYARQCLLARRLVERGVRFVELSCLGQDASDGQRPNPWDQHGGLKIGHTNMAQQVDQPIAALIKDLRSRGLLDETLIIWAGEFGRTPFSQGSEGRDHNPYGFSVWLAGGGVKGGTIYGQTDEYGYHAVENAATVYDLWATVLHQLGISHQDLTYRFAGRDLRLTDVYGNVLHDVIA